MDKPSIGRVVWYRSRTGKYTVPAIVTATTETLAPEGVEAGLIPALTDEQHVHLTVFSPGLPQYGPNMHGEPGPARELPPGATSHNLAGCYQEWDVAYFDTHGIRVSCAPEVDEDSLEQLAGTWCWPERS